MKATELTPSEKIRLLATQGMGWRNFDIRDTDGVIVGAHWEAQDGTKWSWGSPMYRCWDPFTSLDQCAEIEARLTDAQWSRYIEALRHSAVEEKVYLHNSWSRFLMQLSAAQRSEALVEVLGA